MTHRVSIAARIALVTLAVVLLTSWSHAQFKTVFVTSTQTHQGNFGSVAAADNICQTLADNVPLDATNGPYRAWLSTTTTSPAIDGTWTKSSNEYRLVNGTKVAEDYTDLTDGSLDAPINRDESGNLVANAAVWTGTLPTGLVAPATCVDWTSIPPYPRGTIGFTGQAGGGWTRASDFDGCANLHRLYCFQMGPVSVQGSPNHFLSYQIKKSKGVPKFEEREVSLADRFGAGDFEVKKPVALLNPADKNGEGITDRNTHLISYRVKGPKFEKLENVPVEDQFGQLLLDVKRPDRLLVPASSVLLARSPNYWCYQLGPFLVLPSEGK